jgi:hypothetical protein
VGRRDALAALTLANLLEQPRIADRAAANHQPARAGFRQHGQAPAPPNARCRWPAPGIGAPRRLRDQIVAHAGTVHLRHRPGMHGQQINVMPGEERQQIVEFGRGSEAEASLDSEGDRHGLAQAPRMASILFGSRNKPPPAHLRYTTGAGQPRLRSMAATGYAATRGRCGPGRARRCRSSARPRAGLSDFG